MKKSILLSSILATTVLISMGCTKSQDHKKELDQKLAKIDQQNQQLLEQIKKDNEELHKVDEDTLKIINDGGQPGSISLNGAVTHEGKPDERLSITQSGGLNRAGSATAVTKQDLLLVNTLSSEKLEELNTFITKLRENEKTFINIGCQTSELDTDALAGFTEITPKIADEDQIIRLTAHRIYMCGKVAYERLSYSITASEILLKDLDLKYIKDVGSLTLNASALVIKGENRIQTLGKDGPMTILPASSIQINSIAGIFGDGTLSLESKGANNIAEQQK